MHRVDLHGSSSVLRHDILKSSSDEVVNNGLSAAQYAKVNQESGEEYVSDARLSLSKYLKTVTQNAGKRSQQRSFSQELNLSHLRHKHDVNSCSLFNSDNSGHQAKGSIGGNKCVNLSPLAHHRPLPKNRLLNGLRN